MKRTLICLAVVLFFYPYWWGFTYNRPCTGGCCPGRVIVGEDQKQEDKAPKKKKVARRICGAGGCRIVWEDSELPLFRLRNKRHTCGGWVI